MCLASNHIRRLYKPCVLYNSDSPDRPEGCASRRATLARKMSIAMIARLAPRRQHRPRRPPLRFAGRCCLGARRRPASDACPAQAVRTFGARYSSRTGFAHWPLHPPALLDDVPERAPNSPEFPPIREPGHAFEKYLLPRSSVPRSLARDEHVWQSRAACLQNSNVSSDTDPRRTHDRRPCDLGRFCASSPATSSVLRAAVVRVPDPPVGASRRALALLNPKSHRQLHLVPHEISLCPCPFSGRHRPPPRFSDLVRALFPADPNPASLA